jgi:hypothetical protein
MATKIAPLKGIVKLARNPEFSPYSPIDFIPVIYYADR